MSTNRPQSALDEFLVVLSPRFLGTPCRFLVIGDNLEGEGGCEDGECDVITGTKDGVVSRRESVGL